MTPLTGAIIGILVAAIPAFVAGIFVKKKTKAEATDIITQAATRVVETLREALDEANHTVVDLRAQVRSLRTEVEILKEFIVILGGDPATLNGKIHAMRSQLAEHSYDNHYD